MVTAAFAMAGIVASRPVDLLRMDCSCGCGEQMRRGTWDVGDTAVWWNRAILWRAKPTLLFRTVPCNSTVNELRSGESIRFKTHVLFLSWTDPDLVFTAQSSWTPCCKRKFTHSPIPLLIHTRYTYNVLRADYATKNRSQLQLSCAISHGNRKKRRVITQGRYDGMRSWVGRHEPFTTSTKDIWTRQKGCSTRTQCVSSRPPTANNTAPGFGPAQMQLSRQVSIAS